MNFSLQTLIGDRKTTDGRLRAVLKYRLMDDRPYTDCFNNYSLLVDNRRSGAMLQIWTWLQVNIQHLRNSWYNRSIEKKTNLLLNNDLAKIHPLINIQFFEDNRHVLFWKNVTLPLCPISVSGGHVSSADDSRKVFLPNIGRHHSDHHAVFFFLPVKVHYYEDNNTMFIILNIWLYYIGGFVWFFFYIFLKFINKVNGSRVIYSRVISVISITLYLNKVTIKVVPPLWFIMYP